jgi:hypothetical protein
MKNRNLILTVAVFLGMITGLTAQNVPSYVPTNGLVGWWPFNGNANDESGNGNNGTVNGATITTDRFGIAGKAYQFDGVSSYIEINNSSSLNFQNGTIAFWLKTENSSGIMIPIVKNNFTNASNEQFVFSLNSSESFGVKYNSSCQTGVGWNYVGGNNPNLSNGNWHLIVGSFGEFIRFYIDGLLVTSINAPLANSDNCPGNIQFGRAWSVYPYLFSGTLDDIVFYNRVLSQQEITALYLGGNTTANCLDLPNNLQQGLVGYWPFCGNALDESGNGNHGTVNGATLTADRFGNAEKAYRFEQNNQNSITGTLSNFNPSTFSISLWGKHKTGQTGNGPVNGNQPFEWLFGIGSPTAIAHTNEGLAFGVYDNTSTISTGSWGNLITTGATIDTIWKNYIITYENNILKIFQSGVLVSQNPVTFNISSFPFCFGRQLMGINEFWNGSLDDIAIWNRALSPQEITQLYNQGICKASITVTDTLLIHTGITSYNPVAYQNTLKVWPNPGNQDITIDAGNLALMQGWKIRVSNAQGVQIYPSGSQSGLINQQQQTLDMSGWGGNGLYFLYLVDPQNNIQEVKKIVLAP